MNKLLLFLAFIALTQAAFAQAPANLSPTAKFLKRHGYTFPEEIPRKKGSHKTISDSSGKWNDTLYYETWYKAKLLGTPTLPISFTKIEYNDGKYVVTPTVSIGVGYTWFTGDFSFNENDRIIVEQKLCFGVVANLGLQNAFSAEQKTSFFAGGFVGLSAFSLFLGYDFASQAPSIGVGSRVDLYTISQNFLEPIGKVRELRRHKKSAIPIAYE